MSLLPWLSLVRSGRRHSAFFRYGIAVSSVGLSLLTGLWFRPFTYRSPNLFFYAAIIISLLYGGLVAGISSTILSALAVNYFFYPPYNQFSFDLASTFNGIYFCFSFAIICWLIDAKWERAERGRIESESRIRLFIEHAPAALAMFDREMRYLHASRRWRTDYGLGDRDLRGVSHYDAFLDIPESWKEAHRRGLAGEVLRGDSDRFERADGSVQWIRWEIRPWRAGSSGVGGILIFTEDITEHVRADEALRRKDQELSEVQRSARLGSWQLDIQNNALTWSEELYRIHGIDAGLPPPSFQELAPHFTPESWGRLCAATEKDSETGLVQELDLEIVRPDGSKRWVSAGGEAVRDLVGRVIGLRGTVQDITERKRAEEHLRQYEKAVEGLEEMIVVVDRDYRYVLANRAFLKYRRLEKEQLVGRHIAELLPAETFETAVKGRLDECFRGNAVRFEMRYSYPELGERDLSISYFPIEERGSVEAAACVLHDITDRKRAEELVRESETAYRTLFESMDEGFCTVEVLFNGNNHPVDFRFLEVNPVFEALTGIPNALGRTMREIAPQHEEHWFEVFGKIALTGEPARFENWAEQLHRWYEVHAFRVGEPQERKVAIFFDDITKRKGSEEALRTSEEQFRTMANTIPQLVWMANSDGWIFWYNQGWYDYTGTTPKEMEGWGWQSVHDPAELPRVMERWQASIATGEPFDMTFPLRSAKGEFRAFLTRVAPIKDASGKVLRWFGTNTDVEGLQRVEAALRESEARLNEAQHTTHIGSWRYLPSGAVSWSDEMYELYKLPRDVPVTYEAVASVMHPEDRERSRNAFFQQLESPALDFQSEYRVVWPDGQVRQLYSLSKIRRNHEGSVIEVVGTVQDVTERKRGEQELLESEERFRQAQKMEAVGRLAGGVAHDFNNILGIIMGYCDIALDEIPTDNPARHYLWETKKAAQRAALLTQQLLAFSRKQVAFPKILDLNDVVRNASKMLLRLVGEDIAVDFRPTVPLGLIKADSGQIEQVLMNLIVNARDAMPTGGKILIETSSAEMDEHYVSQHPGSHQGQYVLLKVTDTGCGVDETIKSRIFEPFFTTKEVGKGTGLGLSTVYGIVKQSEGYIAFYSEPGEGTTFKIHFPTVCEKGTTFAPSVEDAEPPPGSETILVVEDEKNLREVTVLLLQQGGYRVLEAKDAETALKIIANSDLNVDLLLTDVIMPGKSGADLAKEIRGGHPNLRFLFMSGYTGELVERQGAVIEESSFLEKPFSKRSLLTKVFSVLHAEPTKGQDR